LMECADKAQVDVCGRACSVCEFVWPIHVCVSNRLSDHARECVHVCVCMGACVCTRARARKLCVRAYVLCV